MGVYTRIHDQNSKEKGKKKRKRDYSIVQIQHRELMPMPMQEGHCLAFSNPERPPAKRQASGAPTRPFYPNASVCLCLCPSSHLRLHQRMHPHPAPLPRRTRALRLETLPLHPQTPHITPGAGPPTKPPLLIEAFPLLPPIAVLIIAIHQLAQLELVLDIVVVHEARALAHAAAAGAAPHVAAAVGLEVEFLAAAGLHAAARGEAGHGVRGDAIGVCVARVVDTVGVFPREVEEVDAGEDDEEAAEQGDGVNGGGGVEALEEEAGGDEGAGGEGDVVEGVDAGGGLVVEEVWLRLQRTCWWRTGSRPC